MLRLIHRYQKQLHYIVIIFAAGSALVLALSGTKLRLFWQSGQHDRYALKVGSTEIEHREFYRRRREIDARYRQMFGKNYGQISHMIQGRLSEETKEALIRDTLLAQLTAKVGLVSGKEEVRDAFRSLFPTGFNPEMYRAILSQENLSAPEFEAHLAKDVARVDFVSLVFDSSQPSKAEVRAEALRGETKYDVSYAEFDPKKFEAQVPAPSDAQLNAYFEERKNDYLLPLRVSYQYSVITPDSMLDKVELTNEDIEGYYLDHEDKFKNPEQFHLRLIQLSTPPKASADQIAAVRKTAEEIDAKLQAGGDFSALAAQYSDDNKTKAKGGDIGWVSKESKYPKEIIAAAVKHKEGGTSAPIETPTAFYLVKVEEYKPSQSKELSEVRDEIIGLKKAEEAPLYAANKAADLFAVFEKSDKDLSDFAAANQITAAQTNHFLVAEEDPDPALKGLTAKVLEIPEETTRSTVSLGDKTVIVQVKDRKEPSVPELSEVRARVVTNYIHDEASKLAQAEADRFLGKTKTASPGTTLADLAQGNAAIVTKVEKGVGTRQAPGPLASPDIKAMLSSVKNAKAAPSKVYQSGEAFYVVSVDAVTIPDEDTLRKKLPEYEQQLAQSTGEELVRALINDAEANSEIDYDPNLVVPG